MRGPVALNRASMSISVKKGSRMRTAGGGSAPEYACTAKCLGFGCELIKNQIRCLIELRDVRRIESLLQHGQHCLKTNKNDACTKCSGLYEYYWSPFT